MTFFNYRVIEGSGNSFVLIDGINENISLTQAAIETLCAKHKVDGLLFLSSSPNADCRMQYFNRDGKEAPMCGNGLRCTAFYLQKESLIETAKGLRAGKASKNSAIVDMGYARILKTVHLDSYDFTFIDTGVPHAVAIVDNVDEVDLATVGPRYRHHEAFGAAGTNVSFAKKIHDTHYQIRTYERGVERETGACGTAASALACALLPKKNNCFTITPTSKQDLYVNVTPIGDGFQTTLEGPCHFIGNSYVFAGGV